MARIVDILRSRLPGGGRSLFRHDPVPRIYAIGDIHGRYDLLTQLLHRIEVHKDSLPPAASTYLIFLGDYVDRGPDSCRVVAILRKLSELHRNVICLAGNHDDMMVRVMRNNHIALRAWLRMGGDATLESYGVAVAGMGEAALMEEAHRCVPKEHVEWLAGLPISVRLGGYFFCHAGIRPGVSLRRQGRDDMLWIREDFLEDDRRHECVVVHGHSMENEVQIRANRIGVDTGAYRTGILSAICLEGARQDVIATGPS